MQRRVLYADCASLAKHLLPEDVLRCRYWLVALTQKLILLQTGLDLCNTTVLPTRAVLNFVRRPLSSGTFALNENNTQPYGEFLCGGDDYM